MNEQMPLSPEQPPLPEQPSSLYPFFRKIFFGLCIALFFFVIIYLVYQNGKSIYDNGI